ncbi:hypothetical protein N7448_009240 [Penicillium atrosanguineum]|nr:hypothetical protein N7448_009240 [Penicillium atrosanguineum]
MSFSERKIDVAVIGVGLIGPRHCRTVKESNEARLVAIVDLQPSTAKVAEEFGAAHYTSVQDLIRSSDKPDAAIICTPNHTHASLAKELAAAGIHVLIEKPVSVDISSGRELVEILNQSGVKALVGHHRRFNPYVIAAKEAISSGSLGDITAISGMWTTYKPEDYFDVPAAWRRGKSGGVVLINLIHEVDILHHLFGPITRVHAESTKSRRGYEAEEGAAIVFRFRSGVVGTFVISDNVPSPHNFESGTGEIPLIPKAGADFYRIFGTGASLSVPDMTKWSYDGAPVKSWNEKLSQESLEVTPAVPFEKQFSHFVRVIHGEEDPSCSAGAGLAALMVCEAVRESLQTGQTVEIKDDNF